MFFYYWVHQFIRDVLSVLRASPFEQNCKDAPKSVLNRKDGQFFFGETGMSPVVFSCGDTPGKLTVCYWTWPFIVDLPNDSIVIFHSYVSLPEDNWRIWDAESCCFIFFAHDEARQADFGAEVSVIIEAEEPWCAILQQGGTKSRFLIA